MTNLRCEEYAARLGRLIAEKTVSVLGVTDGEGFPTFRELLAREFPHLFGVAECELIGGALLLRLRGEETGKLPYLFMNHHDVVEAPGEWTHPPFAGEVSDGRIWGRGVLDTKGGLFAMLSAADEVVAEGVPLPRDLYFFSSCNEETTGASADAASALLAERGLRFALVLDEGGMILSEPIGGAKGYFAMVGVGEKGFANLKFTARSRGGHASTPGKGTPLVRLGQFMAEVEKHEPFRTEISPTVCEMFSRLGGSMDGGLGFVLSHPKMFAPILKKAIPSVSPTAGAMLRTTLAFTVASGSQGANVLPREAYVIANMRYSHHEGKDASIEAIRKIAEKFGIETEVIQDGFSSSLTDWHSKGFSAVEDAVRAVFPDVKTVPYVMAAASDCRYMGRVSDCCLRFAPFKIDSAQLATVHGVDENLNISTLADAVDFYKYLMQIAEN